MNNFCKIGKSVLLQAVGLQKNYTEVVVGSVDAINYDNIACSNCKYKSIIDSFSKDSELYKSAISNCDSCAYKQIHSISTYKKIYHNENNRYAHNNYKPTLKSNAIKLLILLHFCSPDKFGVISSANTLDMSKYLHCDEKTVKNNLLLLSTYNYIDYEYNAAHSVTIYLKEYESYFLPAHKGGRGFQVISIELFNELVSINNIVALRIFLRELITLDSLSSKNTNYSCVSSSYTDMRRFLPDYCRPNVIRKSLKPANNIFSIEISEKCIRFEINPVYDCKSNKVFAYNNYIHLFESFIQDFNNCVFNYNSNNYTGDFSEFFVNKETGSYFDVSNFKLIKISQLEINDIASLCMQFSYNIVLSAFCDVYHSYILKDKTINNLGGLLRSIIISKFNTAA